MKDKIKLNHITRQEVNRYCFCNYGRTLDEKLEEICQKWIDKLEDTISKEKEGTPWEILNS